jgi:hypothetical protein
MSVLESTSHGWHHVTHRGPTRGQLREFWSGVTPAVHLLPRDGIRSNLQQVKQRIGTDPLGAPVDGSGDAA